MFSAGTNFDIQPSRKQPSLKFLTGHTGRFPCPALKGIGKCADILIAKQPSDL